MLVRLSAAIAAICMLSGAALAQGAAKLTDPQIAHIAYTAGQLDIEATRTQSSAPARPMNTAGPWQGR
jgi:putative membrane protein